MDAPNKVLVDISTFRDGEERPYPYRNTYFFATIPGLPDGRPFIFCQYHYWSSMEKKSDKGVTTRVYKIWWNPLIWQTWNPLIARTQFHQFS